MDNVKIIRDGLRRRKDMVHELESLRLIVPRMVYSGVDLPRGASLILERIGRAGDHMQNYVGRLTDDMFTPGNFQQDGNIITRHQQIRYCSDVKQAQ